MGSILNNLGLGSGSSSKTAEQVRKCTDHHKEKVKNHKKHRDKIISGQTTAVLLNQVQEVLLEKQKEHIMRQVERQGKVGEGLMRLRIVRKQNDKALQETIEFNERIDDPNRWKLELRLRQKQEMAELSAKRDAERVRMIIEASQIRDQNEGAQPTKVKNADMFNSDKKLASEIFNSYEFLQMMNTIDFQPPEECPDDINEFEHIYIEPKFQTIIQEIKNKEQVLDKQNINLKHKEILKNLKLNNDNLQSVSHSPDQITKQVLDKLYNMQDPYVKSKFSDFKQMQVQKTGLSFLQRMDRDNEARKTIERLVQN